MVLSSVGACYPLPNGLARTSLTLLELLLIVVNCDPMRIREPLIGQNAARARTCGDVPALR
jgi:hypothetical protein